jgi:probable rRNA maturation factor
MVENEQEVTLSTPRLTLHLSLTPEWEEVWGGLLPLLQQLLPAIASAPPLATLPYAVECGMRLATDAEVTPLNQDYRGKNRPTNVLSFPQDDALPLESTSPYYLGDIILAYETIAREAAEQSKPFLHHMTHLYLHGMLHLLGYDHIDPQDAEHMEAQEITLLESLNIANPY